MATIFISYRRHDNPSLVGRIYDRLVDRFGRGNVFKDVDDVPAGVNFRDYIRERLSECEVMLVIIGAQWLRTSGQHERSRLDDPSDLVRVEIETALALKLTIIPIRIDGASIPLASELPTSLKRLPGINGDVIRDDPDFSHDMQRLFKNLPKPTKVSRRTLLAGIGMGTGIVAAAIGAYGGLTWLVRQNPPPTGQLPTLTSRLVALGFTSHVSESLAYVLPPTRPVPAGAFLMGSDPTRDDQAQSNELPQQSLALASFEIAQFPVTVAEYAAYVQSGHVAPDIWQTQITRLDNPVVAVTWNEARDYATWLGSVSGMPWRLVTEAEWEKAARGTDGRRYPWGNNFDTSRANTIESLIGEATQIGAFPNGASPFGVQDMAGNVWQWTSTLFRPYPYGDSDGREESYSQGVRTMRGGSWIYDAGIARSAFRSGLPADDLSSTIGFRLVRST
jgi:formylglycine-generating enzyme required for sulfatase activity